MRVEATAEISRPISAVFAFATDVEKLPLWAGPVTEAAKTSDGPIGIGTTSTRVTQLLGRRFESDYEVTDFQRDESYAAKTTSGPVPIVETMSFHEDDGATKVLIAGEVDASGFFKLAEPLLSRVMKRQVEHDVTTLKDLLEADG